MPVPYINGQSTQDGYTDSLTVIFSPPRPSFAIHISNNAIFYQLAVPGPTHNSSDYQWDTAEHKLIQSLTEFDSPQSEGFIGIQAFSGVRVRSAGPSQPAIVTVL